MSLIKKLIGHTLHVLLQCKLICTRLRLTRRSHTNDLLTLVNNMFLYIVTNALLAFVNKQLPDQVQVQG